MKKCLVFLLAAAILLAAHTAVYAEPTPTPSLPAGSYPLISYGSTGEMVVRIQLRLRELGYFDYKPTGNYQSMTVEAAKKFQQNQTDANGLPIISDGTVGDQSRALLFTPGVKRVDIEAHIPIGSQLSDGACAPGELLIWNEVKDKLTEGITYSVTDYNTGTQFDMVYCGGEGHAEMECANTVDTAAFKETFGGEYNYSKRPVVINVGGTMVAASLQGYPHGEDSIAANEMAGHACMFFEGSLSHVGTLPDVEHAAQVRKAAGK
ncbi:MAG: peptidoglycan-binding protein [Clostridia bacterium]|nr:peptidoglycan-binding protein [Clostridia bacterium]